MVGLAQGAAAATLNFHLVERAGRIDGAINGSLSFNLTTPSGTSSYTTNTAIAPGDGFLMVSGGSSGSFTSIPYATYDLSGSTTWGVGTSTTTGALTSLTRNSSPLTAVGLDISGGPVLILPQGTALSGSFSGSFVFQNASFSQLGITPGTYSYGVSGTSDTVVVTFTPVPLPGALVGAVSTIVLLAALRRRPNSA
jgi:hypothetical protein